MEQAVADVKPLTASGPDYLRAVISGLADNPRAARLKEPPDLVAWLYDASEDPQMRRTLLEFGTAFARTIGTLTSINAVPGRRLADPVSDERACPYCGGLTMHLRVEVSDRAAREVWWCGASCAFIADTDYRGGSARIVSPAALRRGDRAEVIIEIDARSNLPANLLDGSLAFERTPWGADLCARRGVVAEDGPTTRITFTVQPAPDTPPGAYFVVGIVLAGPDLWTCRRPVTVE